MGNSFFGDSDFYRRSYCPTCEGINTQAHDKCVAKERGLGPGVLEGFAAAKQGWSYDLAEGGVKHDGGKIRLDLIPTPALMGMGEVLTFGAKKYTEDNWRKGMSWRRVTGAALRHIFAWLNGEDEDAETGLSHLKHALCCLAFLVTYEEEKSGVDDRWRKAA